METTRDVRWDPAEMGENRTEVFDAMRGNCPVAHSDALGWSVFRYKDVVAVAADPATFSNVRVNHGESAPAAMRGIPLEYDSPEHARWRRMLMPLFSAGRMKAFAPRLRALAKKDLAALPAGQPFPWIASFADPFPVRVISELLGWPHDDWRFIKRMSEDVRLAMAARDADAMAAAHRAWADYIRPVIAARRAAPADDATSWLLGQRLDGQPLSETEMVSILRLLLVAGHGTTTASLGILIAWLAANPDRQDYLRTNSDALPAAIEEMLRWSSPLAGMQRTATADTVIDGQVIAQGDRVALMFAAANRDPEIFPDADQCVFGRSPNRHLVFGSGIHSCLGSPLARLELRIVLGELLAMTRSFSLAGPTPRIDPASWPTNDLREFTLRLD